MSPWHEIVREIAAQTDAAGATMSFGASKDRQVASARAIARESMELANALSGNTPAGSVVVLAMPHGAEFIAAILACFGANVVAVPQVIQADHPSAEELPRLRQVCERLRVFGPVAVLVSSGARDIDLSGELPDGTVCLHAAEPTSSESAWPARTADEDAGAVVLLSSGASAEPKAILLSHGNLWAQVQAGLTQWDVSPSSRVVSWLNPSHSFGLIFGVLAPFVRGASLAYLSNQDFMRRPAAWFELAFEVRATHLAAPNFAFDLALDAIDGAALPQDALASVKCLLSGGEPVRERTVQRFMQAFAAAGLAETSFCAHYGLSETGSVATWNPRAGVRFDALGRDQEEDNGVVIANCGRIGVTSEVVIARDGSDVLCQDGEVGEICVRSRAVAQRYLDRGPLPTRLLHAGGTGFFVTGDRGFLRDGCLYVVGRDKEVIIVRGKNHFPTAIEATIIAGAQARGLLPLVAVFGREGVGREEVVALVGVSRRDTSAAYEELAQVLSRAVAQDHGVKLDEVAFVDRDKMRALGGWKLSRRLVRTAYQRDELAVFWRSGTPGESGSPTKADGRELAGSADQIIVDRLRDVVQQTLGERALEDAPDPRIGPYGLDSLQCTRLAAEIEREFAVSFAAALLYKYARLSEIARHIQAESRSVPAVTGPQAPAAAPPAQSVLEPHPEVDEVAIVAMQCEFPGAGVGPSALWSFLMDRGDAITPIRVARPALWRVLQENAPDPTNAPGFAGLLPDVAGFDAQLFGISRREAESMDPQQRKVLEALWQLFEASGREPLAWRGRAVGVFVAAHNCDYAELVGQRGDLAADYGAYLDSGVHMGMLANRASRWFELSGPSELVNTACSSALVAVQHAVHAIRRGDCEAAAVIGVNLILSPRVLIAAEATGVLAPDGRCKVLDRAADGVARSEGVAGLFLRPLRLARAEGNRILGVIRGVGVSHDGRSNSLRAPSTRAQEALLRATYRNAGVDPSTVGYVELHGTGTRLGDPIEMHALIDAYRALNPAVPVGQCTVGSIKSNLGHTEPVAGLAGLLKVLLALRHRVIPPTLHFSDLNPEIELNGSPFRVATEKQPWAHGLGGAPRRAGVSAFGFGGVSAHVIIEEYSGESTRSVASDSPDPQPALIVLSAVSEEALRAQAAQLAQWLLQEHGLHGLSELAYTMQAARAGLGVRFAIVSSSREQLAESLQTYARTGTCFGAFCGAVDPRVAFRSREEAFAARAVRLPTADSRVLEQLARHWVDGGHVEWTALYAERLAHCDDVPGYAFSRTPYWLPQRARSAQPFESGAGAGPMLRETSLAGGPVRRFSSRFSGEEFFLTGHRVHGEPILPAVVQLELVRVAAMQSWNAESEFAAVRYSDVTWIRPVSAADGGFDLQVALEHSGPDAFTFELYREASNDRIRCCQGTIARAKVVVDDCTDELSLAASSGQLLEAAQCYDAFERAGVTYGPRLKALRTVRHVTGIDAASGCVTADLVDPEPAASWLIASSGMRPSVMDGALQASIGLFLRSNALDGFEAMLPFAVQSVEILAPVPPLARVQVRARGDQRRAGVRQFDASVTDQSGQLCARFRRVQCRVLERGVRDARVAQAYMLAPVMRPVQVRADFSSPAAGQRVAVLGDLGSLPWAADWSTSVATRALDRHSSVDSLSAWLRQVGTLDHVVWIFWEKLYDLFSPDLIDSQEEGVISGFRLITALLGCGYGARPLGLTVVTCQNASTGAVQPSSAAIHGLIASLAKEQPHWSVRVVDLQPQSRWPVWSSLASLPSQTDGRPLLWRDDTWLSASLMEVRDDASTATAYRKGGVYLIIGGAGGLGEVYSEQLIREYQAQVIWVGRRPHDSQIRGKQTRLGAFGPEPHYIAADAADFRAMVAVRAEVRRRFGDVNGIVLAALALDDGTLARLAETRLRASLRAKIDATVQVARAFAADTLDFVLCFSSVVSSSCTAGQSAYAAGSLFLDAYATAWAATGAPVKIVNWGYWGSVGAAATPQHRRRMSALGMGSIDPPAAFRAASQLLCSNRSQITYLVRLGDRWPAELGPVESCDTTPRPSDTTIGQEQLSAAAEQLRIVIAMLLGREPAELHIAAPLYEYGFDSIIVVQLVTELRQYFPDLDSTELFELQSIERFAAHLAATSPGAFRLWIAQTQPETVHVSVEAPRPTTAERAAAPNASQGTAAAQARGRTDAELGVGIAIVGLAGRYPQAPDVDALWERLCRGESCIATAPEDRIELWTKRAGSSSASQRAVRGGYLADIDAFDAAFFDIDPGEAASMDPQERLVLEQAYAAIEDAGYRPDELCSDRRVGVFVGVMHGHYPSGPYYWSIANRVSYHLDFIGPSLAVDSACAASLTAVHLAIDSLRSGSCTSALVAGVNLIVDSAQLENLSALEMLSAAGEVRAFGANADGFAPAEGCGALLLKPLSAAVAAGDHIYGVIRGSEINASGRRMSYYAPKRAAQVDVVARALRRADVAARTVGYVEAHGSGTTFGDAIEVAALDRAFLTETSDRGFCALGSIKSNIGHCESASGMASIAKVLLQFRHKQIVPTLYAGTLNPEIDFANSAFRLQTELTDWDQPRGPCESVQPRRAGISSFGAGGANAHLVVEEYLPTDEVANGAVEREDERPSLIVLSAVNQERLRARAEQLLKWLQSRESRAVELVDIAYTLQVGRVPMKARMGMLVRSLAELEGKLRAFLAGSAGTNDAGTGGSAVELVDTPDDLDDLVEVWIAKGKYDKLLDLWLRGAKIDFGRLHRAERRRRVRLPTYPFARDRFWVNGVATRGAASAVRALPERVREQTGPKHQPIASETVSRLARLWDALLKCGPVTERATFFELGGNSLLAMQLIVRIRAEFGVDVRVDELMDSPTLRELASVIEASKNASEHSLARRSEDVAVAPEIVRTGPLAYPQERIWFVDQHLPDQRSSYHLSFALTFEGQRFSEQALRAAFEQLVARHEVLRTSFVAREHAPSVSHHADTLLDGEPFGLVAAAGLGLDGLQLRPRSRRAPAAGEVEIAVEVAGLNFHDVLSVLDGTEVQGAGESHAIELGGECAGRVVRVGAGVCGFDVGDAVLALVHPALGSHVTVKAALVCKRPVSLSSTDAACVPVAFLTAWYALDQLARLRAGERILVHAASGGVGLAAIQWAKHVGAEIYATAGSPHKRALLKQLGVQFVSDSRSDAFVADVRAWTAGQGVDVVLNSLSGPLIERGLDVLRAGGRFIELGRRDYVAGGALAMRPFLNNLSFALLDLKQMTEAEPERVGQLLNQVVALFEEGVFSPLPLEVFSVTDSVAAFTKFAQASHVGKLALRMSRAAATENAVSSPPSAASPAVQVVLPPAPVDIHSFEIAAGDADATLRRISRRGFDLAKGPMSQVTVLKVGDSRSVVVVRVHHIAIDGWSVSLLVRDLRELYRAHAEARTPQLPALSVQYLDYARLQREQDLSLEREYWRGKLAGYPEGVELPYDYARGAGRSLQSRTLCQHYPRELAVELAKLGQAERVTLFHILTCALAVVVSRYAAREDVCIGTTVAGRTALELEELIGFFVNILPLRLDLTGQPTLRELLRRTKLEATAALRHQALPFEQMLQQAQRTRDGSRVPLVPVMVRHQNYPPAMLGSWGDGLSLTGLEIVADEATPAELDWQFFGAGENLELRLEYAANLFSECTIQRLIEQHQLVLWQLCGSREVSVRDVRVLTELETNCFSAVNRTQAPARDWQTLWSRFQEQVASTPDACCSIALSIRAGVPTVERELCYRELSGCAERLARELRSLGIGPEDRVCVLCDRTPELLAAMLAIFEVRACFVPLDPQHPDAYLAQVLSDAQPMALLTTVRSRRALELGAARELIVELDHRDDCPASKVELRDRPIHPAQLACLAYTSGSEGRPKAVSIPYGQLENMLEAVWRRAPVATTDVLLQKSSVAFTVSFKELLSGLLQGACQVMVPDEIVQDGRLLLDVLERFRVTRLYLVPSHLRMLLETERVSVRRLSSLRQVVVSGEPFARELFHQAQAVLPNTEIWNAFGCTELNDTCYFRATDADSTPDWAPIGPYLPIGTPIENVQVFVLDEELREVPIGATGELHVAAPWIARGYWQQPVLTADRFIPNPHSVATGDRLYRTGDIVRRLADGGLEYVGRRDYEIKVRGHRIDVRQVENVLAHHPAVRSAVVTDWPLRSGSGQLVAYVVAEPQVDWQVSELRAHAAKYLPAYMVPSLFSELPALPQLANGKLDRLALPEPSPVASSDGFIPPESALEVEVATLFEWVLGHGPVGAHDSFFELGGHSLLAARLASEIHRRLGCEIRAGQVLQHPTVRELARAITRSQLTAAPQGAPPLTATASDEIVLSFAQERMWFLHRFVEGTPYNMTGLLRLLGRLDTAALERAMRAIVQRHIPLRSNFVERDGRVQLVVGDADRFVLPLVHIEHEQEVRQRAQAEADVRFDLEQDLLVRACLYQAAADQHYLQIVVHHICTDGVSTAVFFDELAELYAGELEHRPARLPDLTVSYLDYARWERAYYTEDRLAERLSYWRKQLSGSAPLVLPTTYPRPVRQQFAGNAVPLSLDEALVAEIAALAASTDVTPYMVLLSALSVVLGRYSGQTDVCIGSPVANRDASELRGLIGLFVNTLVMRVDLSGDPTFWELLARVKATAVDAYCHQDVPFEQVVEALRVPRDTARSPLVQVMLNLQSSDPTKLQLAGLDASPVPVPATTAKFELTLDLTQRAGQFVGFVEYATALFSEAFVREFAEALRRVLTAVVRTPRVRISRLQLSAPERLRAAWQLTAPHAPDLAHSTIYGLFEQRVLANPAEIAVIDRGSAVSFGALADEVSDLARRLHSAGTEPGIRVAVCMRSSADLIAGILAALRCGAVIVPLPPDAAPDALYQVLFESDAQVVLTESSLQELLPVTGQQVVCVDARLDGLAIRESELPELAASANEIAWLRIAKDQAGRTQRVGYTHRALMLRMQHEISFLHGVPRRFTLTLPLSADLALSELFQWMAGAGTLVIPPIDAVSSSPASLLDAIEHAGAGVLCLFPGALSAAGDYLLAHPEAVRKLDSLGAIFCAGDDLAMPVVEDFLQAIGGLESSVRLINIYSGGAAGRATAYYLIPEERSARASIARTARGLVPIGASLAQTAFLVLDDAGQPVPDGVCGALHIAHAMEDDGSAGRTVHATAMNGNSHRPALDLVSTGDIVCALPDSKLALARGFAGRFLASDRRIDLRVSELALRELGVLRDVVVASRESSDGQSECIAYAVLRAAGREVPSLGKVDADFVQGGGRAALVRWFGAELAKVLPPYMVPDHYVFLEELPVTANGQLDLLALPAVAGDRPEETTFRAAETETGKALARIWRSLLKLERVGASDNFFELGGQSILATQLVYNVRKQLGVELPVTVIFESPVLAAMAHQVDLLRGTGERVARPTIQRVARSQRASLSYQQERLWFIHEHLPDQRTSYNITATLTFSGSAFSPEALRAAFRRLIERHEILRTQFRRERPDEEPRQFIAEPWVPAMPLSKVTADEISFVLTQTSAHVFDLESDRLLQLQILRLSEAQHVVALHVHHIIVDGWSFGVIIRDLQQFYLAELQRREPRLAPLPVQYSDYAVWQRAQDLRPHLQYWVGRLQGYQDGLELPYDSPRTVGRAWRAAIIEHKYSAELATKLAALSASERSTLFITLLAGLSVLMHRYTGRTDLCIGTTVAGRDQLELEEQIGFFVNVLPLRLDLSGNPSFAALMRRVRAVAIEAFEHQALPFEHLLAELRCQRDSSQIPLVPVMVRHQNFPIARIDEWSEGVQLESFAIAGERTTPTEMDWQFFGDGSSLELTLEYASDLFSAATMRRFIAQHELVLEAMLEQPDTLLDAYQLLTAEERSLYAQLSGDTADSESGELSDLAGRFERQAKVTPLAVAAVGVRGERTTEGFASIEISYRELDEAANQVAHYLHGLGVGVDTRVALFCPRHPSLLIGMLAVFKVGACVIPLDPQYPPQYLEDIFRDGPVGAVLTTAALLNNLPSVVASCVTLDIDDSRQLTDRALRKQSKSELKGRRPPHPASLAYLPYTSGSTGKPKGVMVPYGQVLHLLETAWRRSPFAAGEVVLQKTPSSYAMSIKELLSGLLLGFCEVMVPHELARDSDALALVIQQWRATRLFLVPSHLRELLRSAEHLPGSLDTLSLIVTAGEALPRALADQTLQQLPGVVLWNNFGCTELNDVAYFRVQHGQVEAGTDELESVPMGRPIAQTRPFVLDDIGRQVPFGAAGELYIDAKWPARGYFGMPSATAERFVPNPYSSTPGGRLYRTGDKVRARPDGTLEFVERQGQEIKVRGHRVAVYQVEKVLTEHPAVRDAIVSGWPRTGVSEQLVAYLVPAHGAALDVDELRRFLGERLPAYMVPSLYTLLDAMPKLPSGKLDRRTLPDPDVSVARGSFVAPRSELERRLAEAFSEVLEIPQVGVRDDFFLLGGHSLLASQLLSRIRRKVDVDLSMSTIFDAPTVEGLARHIELNAKHAPDRAIQPIARADRSQPIPLSYLQERLWFVHQHMPEQQTSYNGTSGTRLRGSFSLEAMRAAFNALIRRHEILRTVFRQQDREALPLQIIRDEVEVDFEVHAASEADVAPAMKALARHIYDLQRGPLLMVRILRLGPEDHVMLIGMHHIIYDAWSLFDVMSRDVLALYNEALTGEAAQLPELSIQYADYALHQRKQPLDPHRQYWLEQLAGYPDVIELPYDYVRPAGRTWTAGSYSYRYPVELARQFAAFCKAHRATLFMGLAASSALVLNRYTGLDDICIGTTIGGRSHVELEPLIGFFVNILPLRIDLSGDPTVAQLLSRTQTTVLEAFEHQALPFEHLLNALQKQRDSSRVPLVPVMVRHQNFPMSVPEHVNGDLRIEAIELDDRTTPNELDFQFYGDDTYLQVTVEYAADLFEEATIRQLVALHERALAFMIAEQAPSVPKEQVHQKVPSVVGAEPAETWTAI